MLERSSVISLFLGSCVGLSGGCFPVFPGFGLPNNVPLDEANATISVSQQPTDSEATVVATMTDGDGLLIELAGGQAVSVNGQALTGPDSRGDYSRTVPATSQYTITVNEPTRGVEETTLSVPGGFDVTSPASGGTISLSGFTVTWSNADPALLIRVELTQTLFGNQKTQSFGPFTDTGSLSLDNDDLRDFQQGASLLITVTKINERRGVNGFNTATLSSELWQSVSAEPGA